MRKCIRFVFGILFVLLSCGVSRFGLSPGCFSVLVFVFRAGLEGSKVVDVWYYIVYIIIHIHIHIIYYYIILYYTLLSSVLYSSSYPYSPHPIILQFNHSFPIFLSILSSFIQYLSAFGYSHLYSRSQTN